MSNTTVYEKVVPMSQVETLTVVVRQMRLESDGVLSLELVRPDGGVLPPWEPGAHIDVDLGSGILRQYSLCGDPKDLESYRIGVLRESASRGGSIRIHDNLRPSQEVRISAPRNNFELSDSNKPIVFIAGGIGITPILAMAKKAHAEGREFHLYYGGKSRKSMAFLRELGALGEKVSLSSDDQEGMLNLDEILKDAGTGQIEVYVCGPGGLLDAIEKRSADWPKGTFHCERFVPKTIEAPVDGERSFSVSCAKSDLLVTVPADVSILETLERAGVDVPSSCREGTCGTCETGIISGIPDHRDSLLSSDEQASGETMLICVSRCKSDLLELDI